MAWKDGSIVASTAPGFGYDLNDNRALPTSWRRENLGLNRPELLCRAQGQALVESLRDLR